MSKTIIRGETYRFAVYNNIRGYCDKCNSEHDESRREATVLVRIFSPEKKKFAICNRCLIKHLEYCTQRNDRAEAKRQKMAAKKAEREIIKKGKANGTGLSPTPVANVQGRTPPPAKKNDRTGTENSGSAMDGVVYLSQPRTKDQKGK